MSTDVTFEKLEKTAFEFAKAMGAGTGQDLSKHAMKMAEKWHDESALRESLYHAKRAVWEEIDNTFDHSSSDFVVDHPYWVIRSSDDEIVQANFSRYSNDNELHHPMFSQDANGFSCFAITHYIKKEEGDNILGDTKPSRPAGLKKKDSGSRPIPNMKSNWQS